MRCSIRSLVRSGALVAVVVLAPLTVTARADEPPGPKPRQDLFEFGKDPVKPKAPEPTTQPAQVGPAVVKVTSTQLDYVPLGPSTEHGPAAAGGDSATSQDKFFIIRIEIRNTSSDKSLTYHSFALPSGPAGRQTYASLALGRKMLTLVNFGDQEPVGLTRAAEIPPGKAVNDVLVFLPIPEFDAKSMGMPLRLSLPGEQLGVGGKPVGVELPLANVQRRE